MTKWFSNQIVLDALNPIPTTNPNENMITSDKQRAYIKTKEGFSPTSYLDANGQFYDIGYGHTDSTITKGMTITQAQGDAIFDKDIEGFEVIANRLLKVPVDQNCFDAVIDLLYDGIPPTSNVFVLINNNDFKGAGEWIKNHYKTANGVELAGLVTRRQDDGNLIES